MASKNAPCPCGSGKKYKRCCGLENVGKTVNKKYFKKFNTVDLLRAISALTLVKANHGKNLRLEMAALQAVRSLNETEKLITPDELRTYLNTQYPFESQEDLPGNLFTELIAFYGGDYLIMPGITESPAFVLNNLLQAIFNWPTAELPAHFLINASHSAHVVLLLSDRMVKKAGLSRYLYGRKEGQLLTFPASNVLSKLKAAVFFDNKEIQELLSSERIVPEALSLFTIDLADPLFNDKELEENPFIRYPLAKTATGLLIASPASMAYALIQAIKESADQFNCAQSMHKAYHELIWNNSKLSLKRLGFDALEIVGVTSPDEENVFTILARFDDDKIAIIQYWAASQSSSYPSVQSLAKRRSDLIAAIRSISEYNSYQFLDILIPSIMLNELMMPIIGNAQSRSLVIPAHELDILAASRKVSALNLWNYAQARDEQIPKELKMTLLTLLDQYQIYQDHYESFYLSDEGFDLSKWRYGVGQQFIEEARRRTDEHSIAIWHEGRLKKIQTIRRDRSAPIYLSLMDLQAQDFQFAIEGFGMAVWSKALFNGNLTSALRHIYWELTDCIAYWLWQICDDVRGYFERTGAECLYFSFRLDDPAQFEALDESFYRDPTIVSRQAAIASANNIELTIPHELMAYFYGDDNEGDRFLVRQLLSGISAWLGYKEKQGLSEKQIEEIVERRAPLGLKKKLVVIHTRSNLLLDKSHLPKLFYLQEFDSSTVANSIGDLLGTLCPPIGEVVDAKAKKKLVVNIVVRALLPHLKKKIASYDPLQLMQRLIGLNEALISEREHQKIQIPTRIACFVSVEQQIEDSIDKMGDIGRASTATRCLIEHIAAEPTSGSQIVSTAGLQELLAIMDAIINWGSIGDQLTFHLFDIHLSVLPTGRIGTQKQIARDIFDPYYHEKVSEQVADAIDTFKQEFPREEDEPRGGEIPAFVDKAFEGEFGLSLTRLLHFLDILSWLGFQQKAAYAAMAKKELLTNILKLEPGYPEEEMECALTALGLTNRGAVDHVPKGYDGFDISPWRFNRRLSLLRRPIIIVNTAEADNPTLWWGPRQVLLSKRSIADQCWTGRLKVEESGPISKAMGRLANKRGAALVRSVLEKLNIPATIIDSEITIGPNGRLKNLTDIGDVDVLLIDLSELVIYSLECKSFAPSRNMKEMIEECDRLLGSASDKGLIKKHAARDTWLRGHLEELGKLYNRDLSDFALVSAFVTKEGMLFPYLKQVGIDMPFLSVYKLEKDGIEALKAIRTQAGGRQ